MTGSDGNEAIDPITLSVILNRLGSIATEMTLALESAAMTSILGLSRDYSCAIYDARRRQVAMVDALPIHTGSMHLLLERVEAAFGDDLREGDVIACNYPYAGNTHIGDLVALCPVHHDGERVFWAIAKGHQLDVGAPIPSSANVFATSIWQEGLQIPPLKLYDAGRRRDDVVELYLTNVRYREALEGDLMAQLGAIWTAERRLRELCDEFGRAATLRYVDATVDYAERRTREEIMAMPDGVYTAEGWLDDDGAGKLDSTIRCRLEIDGGAIRIDFAGSDPQGGGASNATDGVMQAAGAIPVVMAIDPDIPHNAGCLGCIETTAPSGTICNAAYPAATASATVIPGDIMQDVVNRALAEAIPDRVHAGGARWAGIPMLSGIDQDGMPWGHMLFNGGPGGGASPHADGWPLITTNAAQGGLKSASVEHTELLYPIDVEHWEIAEGSMGLGRRIGGPGVECRVHMRRDTQMVIQTDGNRNPPHGVVGGTPGRGGGHYATAADGSRAFLPGTVFATLLAGERWTSVSTGGGGYGDPLEREPLRVAVDVADGLYDAPTADAVFGVVVVAGPVPAVDDDATERRRAELAAARPALEGAGVVPVAPAASTWLDDTRLEGDVVIDAIADGRVATGGGDAR